MDFMETQTPHAENFSEELYELIDTYIEMGMSYSTLKWVLELALEDHKG